MFRDVPLQPLYLAKFWVGYVVRHKGAPHLRSAGQDLSFTAYHNLDVYLFLASLVVCLFVGIWLFFCFALKWIAVVFNRKSNVKIIKKNI